MNNHHLTTKMLFSNSQQQLPDFWLLAKSDSFLQSLNFLRKKKNQMLPFYQLLFIRKIG